MADELPVKTGVFKIVHLGMGKFTVRPMDKTNVNIDPSGNIAMWGAADEGSQWTILKSEVLEEVTDEMFDELIAKSENVLADVCDVTVAKTQYSLKAANVSTNEPGAADSPIANLVDGNLGTVFVSNRSNAASAAPHHVVVDLGDGVKAKSVQFELYGSNKSGHNYPKNVYVYGSNNTSLWTKVGVINGTARKIESAVLRSTTAYRYWKLDVVATEQKTEDNGAFPWFAMCELKMYDAAETVTLKAPYESVTKSLVTTLIKRVDEAEGQQGGYFRTALSDVVAYEALEKAYDALYKKAAAIDPTVNIDGIEAETNADGTIYDLSGRKVSKAGKGIYIINGKKVLR